MTDLVRGISLVNSAGRVKLIEDYQREVLKMIDEHPDNNIRLLERVRKVL